MDEDDGRRTIVRFTSTLADKAGQAIELTELKSAVCKNALRVWDELRGERAMPARENVTPRCLAPFLRHVTLYEIVDAGEDFKHRVMGDATVQIFGGADAGQDRARLNARSAGMGDVVCRVNKAVMKRRRPLALRGWLKRGQNDFVFHETVMLPLGPENGFVDHILAVAAYGTYYSDTVEPEL